MIFDFANAKIIFVAKIHFLFYTTKFYLKHRLFTYKIISKFVFFVNIKAKNMYKTVNEDTIVVQIVLIFFSWDYAITSLKKESLSPQKVLRHTPILSILQRRSDSFGCSFNIHKLPISKR